MINIAERLSSKYNPSPWILYIPIKIFIHRCVFHLRIKLSGINTRRRLGLEDRVISFNERSVADWQNQAYWVRRLCKKLKKKIVNTIELKPIHHLLIKLKIFQQNLFMLTLNLLENLIFGGINPLKSISNLPFPKGNKLIEGQDIVWWSHFEALVQGSWVIHCFYGISCNVIFIHTQFCEKKKIKSHRSQKLSVTKSSI